MMIFISILLVAILGILVYMAVLLEQANGCLHRMSREIYEWRRRVVSFD